MPTICALFCPVQSKEHSYFNLWCVLISLKDSTCVFRAWCWVNIGFYSSTPIVEVFCVNMCIIKNSYKCMCTLDICIYIICTLYTP